MVMPMLGNCWTTVRVFANEILILGQLFLSTKNLGIVVMLQSPNVGPTVFSSYVSTKIHVGMLNNLQLMEWFI